VLDVAPPVRLEALLDAWDASRRLMFCDEARDAAPAAAALGAAAPGPWAILVGPEGGFAPDEAARLRALPFVLPVTLGPRVLRADTAACAALTLWQATLGDWR
jgi:16S rRNA (uracil1498-N3)-methyltransferase